MDLASQQDLWKQAQNPENWESKTIDLYDLSHPCLVQPNICPTKIEDSMLYEGEYQIHVLKNIVLCDKCFNRFGPNNLFVKSQIFRFN